MRNLSLYLLAIVALVTVACQKEVQPVDPQQRIVSNDSNKLSLYVELDTLHPSGSDTLLKIIFKYDALKRIDSARAYYYDTATNRMNARDIHIFSYRGTDTLPYRWVNDFEDYDAFGGINYSSVNTYQLYYNSNGTPSKIVITTLGSNDSSIQNFSYNGNVSIRKQIYYTGGVPAVTYDSTWMQNTLAGGNVVAAIFSQNFYVAGLWNNNTTTYTATFDNHPNPFVSTVAPVLMYGFPSPAEGFYGGHFMSVNNVTSYTEAFSYGGTPGGQENYTASYTYNAAGLPVIARYHRTNGGGAYQFAGRKYYFYTN
jgi:hypothetical protein